MANARDVLDQTIREAKLLANTGGSMEDLQELARLAYDAWKADQDGTDLPDARARILHSSRWSRLRVG